MPMPITPSRPTNGSAFSPNLTTANGDALTSSLLAAFPRSLLNHSSPFLPQLASLLRIYGGHITPVDLFYKAEAILLQEKSVDGSEATLTDEIVEQLRRDLQKEWETKSVGERKDFFTPVSGVKQRSGLGSLLGITPKTPVTPAAGGVFAKSSTTSSFSDSNSPSSSSLTTPATIASSHAPPTANGSSGIIETLNPHISLSSHPQDETMMRINDDGDVKPKHTEKNSRVGLAVGTDPRAWGYRYMFERPGMKGHALDQTIEDITKVILETYDIAIDDIADPSVVSQETVYVAGRICPALSIQGEGSNAIGDNDKKTRRAKEPKLTDGVVIEASKTIGSGSRTLLRFTQNVVLRSLREGTKQYMNSAGQGNKLGLVPGMICAFKGRNGGGEAFVAEEIMLPPPLPHAATKVSEMLQNQHSPARLDGDNLKIYVSSGPYTNDDDLNFGPWHRLMSEVEKERPDVILLLGPFLPASHAVLNNPDLDQLPVEIFKQHISQRLNVICENSSRTTAILMPSTKDIVHSHIAWPQPMLEKSSLGLHKRIKCLPNPCLFSINEIVFGASTADALRDLRSEEIVIDVRQDPVLQKNSSSSEMSDAMARSVRTLLGQRSFYPIFPASSASQLPLDVTHSSLAQFKTVTPDVLLLPTVLTPFARVIDGTVCVNPGPIARGAGQGKATEEKGKKGSWARFEVQAMKKDRLRDLEENGGDGDGDITIGHEAFRRCRVDLCRI